MVLYFVVDTEWENCSEMTSLSSRDRIVVWSGEDRSSESEVVYWFSIHTWVRRAL